MRTGEVVPTSAVSPLRAEAATRPSGSETPDARLEATPAEDLRVLPSELLGVAGREADKAVRTNELLNMRLSFVFHEESGRMSVRVVNTETNEIIRQIPPERMLQMLAEVREMIGLILDEKV